MNSSPFSLTISHFLRVNGWLIATLVGLATIEDLRSAALGSLSVFVAIFVMAEVVIFSIILAMQKRNQLEQDEPKIDLSWHVEGLEIRFGEPQDSYGTESVYHEWFSDDVSINDDEYDAVVARRGFIRVIEADMKRGGFEQKIIVGYYSVFPISMSTYDDLTRGRLLEQDLKCVDVLDPSDPLAKVLYIPEICESKGRNVGPALVRDMMRYVAHMVNNNQNISIIAAWPYTKYGKKLISDFNMKKASGKRFFQRIYFMTRASAATNRLPTGGFKDRRRITF